LVLTGPIKQKKLNWAKWPGIFWLARAGWGTARNLGANICAFLAKFGDCWPMPKITIVNLAGREIAFGPGPAPLLRLVLEAGVDWMHACGGKGRCTTCKAEVLAGAERLSPLSPFEQQMRAAGRLGPGERLACQCVPTGDVRLRVPASSQLPHLQYTEIQ
jgi:ferredoxin, 2Fe-2S